MTTTKFVETFEDIVTRDGWWDGEPGSEVGIQVVPVKSILYLIGEYERDQRVRLPKPFENIQSSGTIDAYKQGWNDCIDESKRISQHVGA